MSLLLFLSTYAGVHFILIIYFEIKNNKTWSNLAIAVVHLGWLICGVIGVLLLFSF